mmetsp:Transcript_10780/g.22976  ORF Transcript_10780/g.22976 Transcript_10780/m.22976 type:complete len:313 (+) Transcript_10780:494-1432(+)|eukprot:CAMPEP_0168182544 /NCGR_PEP_ID=MMETSP0139_2-20121125/11951_1 /TAXON_ID=44445 /ORGANISM="Pseudo-nitzschia australis, Strain 10249 10 AB" /LENGTH=312 /DNA_ID=CAMNT_0008103483 /DNA_START=425 /DNA_END=1363 /DNA_ORIENTATION=+
MMMWFIGLLVVVCCYLFFSVVWPLFILLELWISFIAMVAVSQERKVWLDPLIPSLTPVGMLKVYCLNVVWMTFCSLGSVLTFIESAVTNHWLDLKHTREFAHKVVERNCAKLVCSMFVGPVVVKGAENLPAQEPGSPAPVYLANHTSQIDSAAVYFIDRPWRWIMKSSIMYMPGVGQITYLADHIWIDRKGKGKNKESTIGARNLFVKSDESIQEGTPMFFFPQGTRRMAKRLPFKDGAFKVATNNDSLLVPISIRIPLTAWNSLYPFGKGDTVVLTVHKPIESKGKDIETLKKETAEVMFSILPDHSKKKD